MRLLWRLLIVLGLGLAAGAILMGFWPREGVFNPTCGSLLNPHIGCEDHVARGGAWPIFWVTVIAAVMSFGAAFVIWLTEREQRQ